MLKISALSIQKQKTIRVESCPSGGRASSGRNKSFPVTCRFTARQAPPLDKSGPSLPSDGPGLSSTSHMTSHGATSPATRLVVPLSSHAGPGDNSLLFQSGHVKRPARSELHDASLAERQIVPCHIGSNRVTSRDVPRRFTPSVSGALKINREEKN